MDRILFITSTRIGDAVMSSGLLTVLAARHPVARITVAAGPLAAPLFEHAPQVEAVIVMAKRPNGGHWFDLWRATRAERWDLVVDLRGSRTSWFLRTKARAIADRPKTASHKVTEAGAVLGLAPPPAPRVWLSDADYAAADQALGGHGRVLALAPTASAPFKEWPAARFAELAERLTGPEGPLAGAHVAAFGGPGDEAVAAEALAGVDPARAINLAGRLGLRVSAACLHRARLFVGNDSGLMHIAAAAGAPTLGLFGPTDENTYGPWGAQARALRGGAPADASERARLRHVERSLMEDLGVDAVFETACAMVRGEETTAWRPPLSGLDASL